MQRNDKEWFEEKQKLENVLAQVEKQLKKSRGAADNFRKEVIRTQRSMWDEVNPTPTDLDDLANVWQYQNDIEREGRKALFALGMVGRLERMRRSPYFGRTDFREDGEEKAERIYIGLSNLTDDSGVEYLVYDWRAPVAGMFYDCETGRASYRCPAGTIEGEMTLKRQYRIWDGVIQSMFDCNVKIDDEILQDILSRSTDQKMKTIVTTIQREQNRIIRDDLHRLLIVQGPAGSGKTSVALHRVAYLLYRYREEIGAENIVVFSPNEVFSDYISSVLPELGEENMHRTTFMEYAARTLEETCRFEGMSRQMEYILTAEKDLWYDARMSGIRYKSSKEFVKVLRSYADFLAKEYEERFEDIVWKDTVLGTREEIQEYFRRDLSFLPIGKRLEKIRNRYFSLMDPLIKERIDQLVVELADSGEFVNEAEILGRSTFLAREEFKPLKDKITAMTQLELMDCYRRLFADGELRRQLSEGALLENLEEICVYTMETLQAGELKYEDLAPVLYLKGLVMGTPSMSQIKYVIIDEVQDYTPVQLQVFRQLFGHCSLTMLGDTNQAINAFTETVSPEDIVEGLGIRKSEVIRLSRSYRSTRQIAAFCRKLLQNRDETECIRREGAAPKVLCFTDSDLLEQTMEQEVKHLKQEGFRSIALICRSVKDSEKLFAKMGGKIGAKLVRADDSEFSNGTVIIPSYLAKGLEFDAVIVCNAGKGSYDREEERKLLYTVCTRALHKLSIFCEGQPGRFIEGVDREYYEKVALQK